MIRTFTLSSVALAIVLICGYPAAGAGDLPVTYNFLVGSVSAGYPFNADPPGANDWHCRPTREHPRPVILVHGTGGNKNTNWRTYAPLLKNNGYCVYALTYGVTPNSAAPLNQLGGMTDMRASAVGFGHFVATVLRATRAHQVDLIGHSQGTLMPNYYVKFLGGARYVHDYISLAPVWHGTQVTALAALMPRLTGSNESDAAICAACAEFAPGSAFLAQMHRGPVAVHGVSYTNIVSRNDELIVPYTSGLQQGMRNVVIQNVCALDHSDHLELAADPVASVVVLNTLDPAHPRPVPCMLVLPAIGAQPGS